MTARSWLFLPANRADRLAKAMGSGADTVILDLEDAVAPDQKDSARAQMLQSLQAPRTIPLAVRINPTDTEAGLEDMLALLRVVTPPDVVILPKTDAAAQIRQARKLLPCRLMALVETARGVMNAAEIMNARPDFIAFGAADYAADLGTSPDWPAMASARSRLVEAAASQGLPAIDSPCFALTDAEAIRAESEAARGLGFVGKLAIHPAQIPPLHAAFTPSEAETLWARRVLEENSKGAAMVDGKLVDEAIARQARRILSASQIE